MKKVIRLLELVFCKAERGLWYDHDKKIYDEKGWGITIKLFAGKMIRPVRKFWIKDSNPWKGDEPWFVIRIPFVVVPFVSIAIWNFGAYFGFKVFDAKDKHRSDDRYGKWMRENEFGTDAEPAEYLQLSATTRSTRWK